MSKYEFEDFQDIIDSLTKSEADVERLKHENEQLREALKKCSPYMQKSNPVAPCHFCGKTTGHNEPHTDDCEYVKLCGGNNDRFTKA